MGATELAAKKSVAEKPKFAFPSFQKKPEPVKEVKPTFSFFGKSEATKTTPKPKVVRKVAKKTVSDKPSFSFAEKILGVKKGTPVAKAVLDLDLWAPVKDSNNYGARRSKNLSVGKLGAKSYVPAGMSKEAYEKIRSKESRAKQERYNKFAAKEGIFQDYTEFYKARGTDKNMSWRSVTNGHRFAKTKYDWQGDGDMAGNGSTGR